MPFYSEANDLVSTPSLSISSLETSKAQPLLVLLVPSSSSPEREMVRLSPPSLPHIFSSTLTRVFLTSHR